MDNIVTLQHFSLLLLLHAHYVCSEPQVALLVCFICNTEGQIKIIQSIQLQSNL